MRKLIAVTIGVLSFYFNVFSQAPNGPGGIFSRAGVSNLKGWYDATDLDGDDIATDNPANGTAVSSWSDKSSSLNHLLQPTGANQPTYNTAGTYDAVNFIFSSTAGLSDFMTFTTPSHYSPGTAYFVLLPTDPGAALEDHILMDDATRSLRLEQWNNTNRLGVTVYGVSDYTSTLAPNYGAYTILSFHKSTANNNMVIRQNASAVTLNIASTTNGIPMTRMGKNSTIEAANYNCVEIISYGALLNNTQIRILENYLSSKYGSITIANDVYAMDSGPNGNHDFEVAGVGRVAAGDTHTDAQGGIIRMSVSNPATLINGEFLLWGHNNGALTPQSTDLPTGIQTRLTRSWGVTETGDVGNMNIQIDMTGLGSVTPSDLRLLVDADNDGIFNEGSTTQTAGATFVSGNTYQFAGVNLGTSVRFTIGSVNSTQTPLPVELTFFKGTFLNNEVHLSWQTAMEINNQYFTISRSLDGKKFSVMDTIQGAGNSNALMHYAYVDHFPAAGLVYYQLKQTDFDGQHSMSKVIAVKNGSNDTRIAIYPNPVAIGGGINIKLTHHREGDMFEARSFVLVDLMGNQHYLDPGAGSSHDSVNIIIPHGLHPGAYFLKIGNRIAQRIFIKH
jgi:hypothetical protein